MKSNVFLKITIVLLTAMLMVSAIGSIMVSFANDNFKIDEFENHNNASIDTPVSDIAGAILNVVRTIGLGVAIIMLAFVAIKYLIAAPGDRADLKKSSIQYVVGAVVVFGATNILAMIIEFVQDALPIS